MASRIITASLVATLAFWAYTRTLLPGVDLGDTGGFQAAVLWPEASARQAYPLYYALARPFVSATSPANPARGLNLFSAVWAAVAVGTLVYVTAALSGSLAGGTAAGLLLAFSYTFWTQAVIAEVYSLELALIGACLIALLAYAARPGTRTLALFFAIYAFSFGNHLGMILFVAPFALFLVMASPDVRTVFRPTVIGLVLGIAVLGALQYWPNLMAVWRSPDAPERWADRIAAFWFDVTKADWRESMVFGVRPDQIADRLAMWMFDARQQFGIAGAALAFAGVILMWARSRTWSVLLIGSYVICTGFALTYNVGDTHVFFLPGHFITALYAGAAVPGLTAFGVRLSAFVYGRRSTSGNKRYLAAGAAFSTLVFLYAAWRGWDTWPAVDRHRDHRAEELVERITSGVRDESALLVEALDWQVENALLYAGRHIHPDVAWVRLADVLPHFPFLVEDNHAVPRDVVMTSHAAADVVAAYGAYFPIVPDEAVPTVTTVDVARRIPVGSPYVLCILTPPRNEPLDDESVSAALTTVTAGHLTARSGASYEVIAGVAGAAPVVQRASDRPFTLRFQLLDEPFTVRMDSWLQYDTFRRGGFGHVLRGREHAHIVERGLNLVWFTPGTGPQVYYAAGLYAPHARYRIPAAAPRLARTGGL